jgi:hypothetical protein
MLKSDGFGHDPVAKVLAVVREVADAIILAGHERARFAQVGTYVRVIRPLHLALQGTVSVRNLYALLIQLSITSSVPFRWSAHDVARNTGFAECQRNSYHTGSLKVDNKSCQWQQEKRKVTGCLDGEYFLPTFDLAGKMLAHIYDQMTRALI